MNDFADFPEMAPDKVAPAHADQVREAGSLFSMQEISLTWIIMLFALVAVLVFYLLVRNDKATAYSVRMFVIVLIIFGTLLVVSSSYATEQLSPVVGLFGTIAGYLLGKSEKKDEIQ